MDNRARLFDNVGDQRHHAADFLASIGEVVKENSDIVVRVGMRITTRTGSEQHNALDAVAEDPFQCTTKARKDWIVLRTDSN